MMAETNPAEEVQRLLAKWNPPPEDHALERIVGVPTDEGDGRATAHVRAKNLDHPQNPADDSVDAARMFADDGDDGEPDKPYEDQTNDELRAELERRGLPKSGNKDELIERLEEDDDSDE